MLLVLPKIMVYCTLGILCNDDAKHWLSFPYHFFLWDLLGHQTLCRGNTPFLSSTFCICYGLSSVGHIYLACFLCTRNGKSSTLIVCPLRSGNFFFLYRSVLKRSKSYQPDTRSYTRWFTSFSVVIIITIVNASWAPFTSGEKSIKI